jgi:hypothetical protein
MSRSLAVALLLPALTAHADESLTVCYNYECASKAEVRFHESRLDAVGQLFAASADPEAERTAIAKAVGAMYRIAGEQTPIWRDKGGDYADDGVDGRMDCIDHSTNTHAWIALFARRGWLRFHTLHPPVRRGLVLPHWAVRIGESSGGRQYVVDSWFFDSGEPAVVFRLEEWMRGAIANGVRR